MERLNRIRWSLLSAAAAGVAACATAGTSPETPSAWQREQTLEPAFMPTAPRVLAPGAIAVETPAPVTTALPNTPPEPTNALCPAAVKGAEVNVSSLNGSVALEFAAPADSRYELRNRVDYLANIYAGTYTVFHAFPHPTSAAIESRGAAPRYSARSEYTGNGARIVFAPEYAADITLLREEVAADADVMSRVYLCPMLSDVSAYWPATPVAAPTIPAER